MRSPCNAHKVALALRDSESAELPLISDPRGRILWLVTSVGTA